jgi:hypothetical protein
MRRYQVRYFHDHTYHDPPFIDVRLLGETIGP